MSEDPGAAARQLLPLDPDWHPLSHGEPASGRRAAGRSVRRSVRRRQRRRELGAVERDPLPTDSRRRQEGGCEDPGGDE